MVPSSSLATVDVQKELNSYTKLTMIPTVVSTPKDSEIPSTSSIYAGWNSYGSHEK